MRKVFQKKKMDRFLDLCVSSLRRGHANLLCIVPNFVNVFGFPLGQYLAGPLLYMPHRATKLTVRGPQLAEVAQACSRCALGISQELRNTQRRCRCSILASVRVRGAGEPRHMARHVPTAALSERSQASIHTSRQ